VEHGAPQQLLAVEPAVVGGHDLGGDDLPPPSGDLVRDCLVVDAELAQLPATCETRLAGEQRRESWNRRGGMSSAGHAERLASGDNAGAATRPG
jgi:hypothetical protein